MHPLRQEFIKEYKSMGNNKEFLKKYEDSEEDRKKRQQVTAFIENEKEEIDISEAETLFFSFGESNKKRNVFFGFEFAAQQAAQSKKKGQVVNLYVPEKVDIDYSEYSNIPLFKNNMHAQLYKDGMLIILPACSTKRTKYALNISISETDLTESSPDGKIVIQAPQSCFRNCGMVNWSDQNFDDGVILYVVAPQIIKNKALRIDLKKNKRLNKLLKFFRDKGEREGPPEPFTYFYSKASQMQNILSNIFHFDVKDPDGKDTDKMKEKYKSTLKELLSASYYSELVQLVNEFKVANIKKIPNGKNNGNKNEDCWLNIDSYKNKSIEEIKKEYLENIFPHEQHLEDHSMMNRELTDKMWGIYMLKKLLKMVILYYHTEEGTTLIDGTLISYDYKTEADCILFWKKINVFELLFNVLNKYNFPLCVIDSQVINDVDLHDKVLSEHIAIGSTDFDTDKTNNETGKLKFDFKDKHILTEAMESEMGYLMPYDGVWEIPHDPIYSSLKFREYDDFITILLFDHRERYFIEVFSKKERDFKYMLWNHLKENKDYSENCLQEIYTKMACCIRDGKVLIERDSSMSYQGRRKPYGCSTDSVYDIWMPRRKYHRTYNKEQSRQDKDFFSESRVFSGSRRAHPRKLPSGSKPSKLQMLLAKNENITLNPGYTFVRKCMWGDKDMPVREVRYRTRSLSGRFYYDKKEMSEAKKIDIMSGSQFEEYCEKYIVKQGWEVYKRRNNYDGGIDIRAWRDFKDGSIKTLLVQCKKWNSPIPPEALRAFKTATDDEEVHGEKVLMFMASGQYSPGARESAKKYNVELIEGDHFLKGKNETQ